MKSAEQMSNSMLIEYLYEIEDLNDYISRLGPEFRVEEWLGLMQKIVQEHLDLEAQKEEEEEERKIRWLRRYGGDEDEPTAEDRAFAELSGRKYGLK